jgi:hypothetical protein
MVVNYIIYAYYYFKKYFTKYNYNLPFDKNISPEFIQFKKNNVHQVIFALNNIPETIHTLLFKENKNICPQYFEINVKIKSERIIEIYHYLEHFHSFFNNNFIKYIYIRVNIFNYGIMNHVNCIIIDKEMKYILYFEPKVEILFDLEPIFIILEDIIDLSQYKKLIPYDIGYNFYNRLQKFDAFCQTYVIFVFLLIIHNEHVDPRNFSNLFNSLISYQSMGYFLFHIYGLLQKNNYEINAQPTNKLKNFINFLTRIKNEKPMENIYITETEDFTMIDKITDY